jgi:hypothetical protein
VLKYHILSSSFFFNHPNIQGYKVRDTAITLMKPFYINLEGYSSLVVVREVVDALNLLPPSAYMTHLYCIHSRNEGALSLVSDTVYRVVIRSFQASVLNKLPVFKWQWEIQTHAVRKFRKAACTKYDLLWSVE